MKDYQPTKNNSNWIPHNQYMQTLWFIRSYYDLKQQHDDIINESPAPSDGQPRGTGISDPTSQKAQKIEALYNDILIIEKGIKAVPEEHREIIWKNVMEKKSFKDIGEKADSTYRYWKSVFIRHVAETKKII